MQTPAAQMVLAAAGEDRSYAGAFAYESQMPMKVFMGESPCVPLPTVVDALNAQQQQSTGGGGSSSLKPQDINALRKVIGMDIGSCSMQCSPALWECMSSSPGKTLSDKISDGKVSACMQSSMACYKSCITKTPGS